MQAIRSHFRALVVVVLVALPSLVHAEWQAVEQVRTYAISGKTAPELYFSMGERGPKAGIGRAIAYTDFKLTWSRKYEPMNGACTLVWARPNLTIIYMLPKPGGELPPSLKRHWDIFAAGVAAHERVHGDIIKDMVRKIEAVSVGLSVPDDPKCTKIRKELTTHLARLSNEQRQRSRDFDRLELSEGGKVHQLILAFVNSR